METTTSQGYVENRVDWDMENTLPDLWVAGGSGEDIS